MRGKMKTFAAIDVGSYEIGMKIFELAEKRGLKELDYVRQRMELGTDTYLTGRISYEKMDELCEVLSGFVEIMNSYKVSSYRAYGTSAMREAENTDMVLDQIRLRTGLEVSVLSNSEQRFLDYKSVALNGGKFENFINQGTAFVDIGGGSTQVSLFSGSHLTATVNMHLGILKIRDRINFLKPGRLQYESMVTQLIENELDAFEKLYLSDIDIQNIIVIDDYLPFILQRMMQGSDKETVSADKFVNSVNMIKTLSEQQLSQTVGISDESVHIMMSSAFLVKCLIDKTAAERLWIPGVTLSDGIAYDYAQKNKFIKSSHNFDTDIISCAKNISLRYRTDQQMDEEMALCALAIFDSMKKLHGLGKRERLLLELAARLRSCGTFVSLNLTAECTYSIIIGTEIIGISHRERQMVAAIAMNSYQRETNLFHTGLEDLGKSTKLTVSKLTAMLHMAAGMVLSPHKEYKSVKAVLKDRELIITIDTEADLGLERGLFAERTAMFEEAFGIRPTLKTKRRF